MAQIDNFPPNYMESRSYQKEYWRNTGVLLEKKTECVRNKLYNETNFLQEQCITNKKIKKKLIN